MHQDEGNCQQTRKDKNPNSLSSNINKYRHQLYFLATHGPSTEDQDSVSVTTSNGSWRKFNLIRGKIIEWLGIGLDLVYSDLRFYLTKQMIYAEQC